MPAAADPGLCGTCGWARIIATRRGSRFYLCARSRNDPSFPQYPRLPVIRCRGFERGEPAGPAPPAGSNTVSHNDVQQS